MKFIKTIVLSAALLLPFFIINAQKEIVNGKPTLKDEYAKKNGNLRMSKADINFKKILNNESRNDTFKLMNDGKKEMTLSLMRTPIHIKGVLKDSVLAPGEKTFLAVSYDASKRNDFGFVFDRIMLQTNDSVNPRKILFLKSMIEEYFPPMTSEDSAIVPVSAISKTEINFGQIETGQTISGSFWIYNKGKRNLVIHTAKSITGTVKAEISKHELVTNDSAQVNYNYIAGAEGEESKKITVFVNDPFKPKYDVNIKGVVTPKK